jgi:AcrR family transcriptional regulator
MEASRTTSRRRRSSQEVREKILEIARKLFDERGYEATTTMQIAQEAGISERLIFSHFGTKEELFNAAVITPFASVIRSYMETTLSRTRHSNWEDRIDYFVRGLYDLAMEHRTALLTALEATSSQDGSPHGDVFDYLARSFQDMLLVVEPSEEYREDYDAKASLAAFVGMVFGVALLEDLIFPAGARRPSRQRLIDEMRKTTLVGVMRHPTPWTPRRLADSDEASPPTVEQLGSSD